jgi:hypothetical protein
LKDLADIHFAHAKTIVLVQDNLNIHSKASLYEAFPAVEARRLVERFEWHYTPKHGSWLDLAESELGVLTSQCLDRRIPNNQILIDEIAAWEHDGRDFLRQAHQRATHSRRLPIRRRCGRMQSPSGHSFLAPALLERLHRGFDCNLVATRWSSAFVEAIR